MLFYSSAFSRVSCIRKTRINSLNVLYFEIQTITVNFDVRYVHICVAHATELPLDCLFLRRSVESHFGYCQTQLDAFNLCKVFNSDIKQKIKNPKKIPSEVRLNIARDSYGFRQKLNLIRLYKQKKKNYYPMLDPFK